MDKREKYLQIEHDLDELEYSINFKGSDEKYLEILDRYKGHKHEWKLYRRTNIESEKYYLAKAKFVLSCFSKDYSKFINFLCRGREKYHSKETLQHYSIVKNKHRVGMHMNEFAFRLENVRILINSCEIPELAEYSTLIHMHYLNGMSIKNIEELTGINRGSVVNELKKLDIALAKYLKARDYYKQGLDFAEQLKQAEEIVDAKEKVISIAKLKDDLERQIEENSKLKEELTKLKSKQNKKK